MREKTEGGLRLCVGDIRGEGQTARFEAMCGRYKG